MILTTTARIDRMINRRHPTDRMIHKRHPYHLVIVLLGHHYRIHLDHLDNLLLLLECFNSNHHTTIHLITLPVITVVIMTIIILAIMTITHLIITKIIHLRAAALVIVIGSVPATDIALPEAIPVHHPLPLPLHPPHLLLVAILLQHLIIPPIIDVTKESEEDPVVEVVAAVVVMINIIHLHVVLPLTEKNHHRHVGENHLLIHIHNRC